jgi:hypothetical protein
MLRTKRLAAQLCRIGACGAVLIGTGAANWIDPKPLGEAETGTSTATVATAGPPAASIPLPQQSAVAPQTGAASSGLGVTQWRFSDRLGADPNQPPAGNIAAGKPLYLWLVLDGTGAAVDDMRSNGLMIQVHWVRDSASGAPDLVTQLTVGRPGLADTFEQQVKRKGFFEWHSWARKDTVSPGTWTVSLTYPDGRPLSCGQDAQPCRFQVNVS